MENPEEILHSLEEFSKMKPKDIPRELEEYLCFVAKTGNPVYQWPIVKSLFREKLLSVITEFYESCPSVDIPPCPNVEMFNYDLMKNFILEKLDTFAAAPFTVQRICELLTTPRKEYNRIDKYMRALEKNILVVSTTEPGRRSTENGEGIMNGIESEHLPESSNSSHDINVEEMDESPSWPRAAQIAPVLFDTSETENQAATEIQQIPIQDAFENGSEAKLEVPTSSTSVSAQPQLQSQQETVITCRSIDETPYVSIEPVPLNTCASHQETTGGDQADSSVTITAVPAGVQQRRNSVERVGSTDIVHTEAEKLKETPMPEGVKEKPEKEEENHTPKEQISSTTLCPEPIEETTTETKLVMHTEEAALAGQEESGIENISPENSSSSPETLQIDVNSEQEKNQPEKIEKADPSSQQPQTEEKEIILESSEWSEVNQPKLDEEDKGADVSTTEIKEQELDGIPLEPSDEGTDEEKVQDCKHFDGLEDSSEESSSITEEQEQVKEVEPVCEPSPSDLHCKIDSGETPMEIDIVSEEKLEQKEESVTNEPSSTSDPATL